MLMHTHKKGPAAAVVAAGWWQSHRGEGEVWRGGSPRVVKKSLKMLPRTHDFQYFRLSGRCSKIFGGKCIFNSKHKWRWYSKTLRLVFMHESIR